jgi:MFS family permease
LNSSLKYGDTNGGLTPNDMDRIRLQAQSDTANLYFISSFFSGIPVIIMTNILGVNCSTLGRKTLMLIYLFAMTLKFTLILFQCIYPDLPDWLFYAGAFIEGISGSSGVFYLSLYCFIADLTTASSRSYRITFLNNLNSIASLCVTFICGYVITYYGYFYLFLTSLFLIFVALVYTIFLIPEPLIELRHKSFVERLSNCSLKRTFNSFKVYFKERVKVEDRAAENEEQSALLLSNSSGGGGVGRTQPPKQTFVLLLIVFANFVYCFAASGIGSIFTLFIMNAPFCFNAVQISQFSVFATIVSLSVSFFVSKFVRVNDLLICLVSVASYFAALLCYIYGNTIFHVYLSKM